MNASHNLDQSFSTLLLKVRALQVEGYDSALASEDEGDVVGLFLAADPVAE
jgi:hypothetical protein